MTSSKHGHYFSIEPSIKSINFGKIKKSTTVTSLLFRACALTFFDASCVHQAIEGFALMVKKTAQTLQSFGTELAETELPNEIQATGTLLSTHTNKKDKMKVTPSRMTCTVSLYISVYCVCVLVTVCILDITPSVCRRICWWLWIRAAGCWRASMSP